MTVMCSVCSRGWGIFYFRKSRIRAKDQEVGLREVSGTGENS